MKRWLLLLMVPTMALASTGPKDIERDINHYGVNGFSTNIPNSEWMEVLSNISLGKSEWIALAPKLALVIDREQAGELNDALFYAIEPNAKDTLSILSILDKHNYRYQQGTDVTCPSKVLLSEDAIKQHYNNTRIALLNVGPQGADCLWLLEGIVEEIKSDKAHNE